MNIFITSKNPVEAAQNLDDVRLERLCFECLEMLSMAILSRFNIKIFEYRERHLLHPVSIWIRTKEDNYNWALAHGIALCKEYLYRFGYTNKYHKYYRRIIGLTPVQEPVNIDLKFRNSTIKFKHIDNVVEAYRLHYAWKLKYSDKYKPKKWTKRQAPSWLKTQLSDIFYTSEQFIKEI